MMRSALPLSVVALAALCFACVPAPPPGAPGVAGPTPRTCTAGAFLSKVSYLTTPFNPPASYLPPTGPLPSGPGVPDYAGDLTNAFNAASPAFQQQLCTLDAVYINAVACPTPAACFGDTWGWRQRQPQPATPNGRVVALSAGLWNDATYSQYETDLTQSLLPPSTLVSYGGAQSCSKGACQPVDNMATMLLAALAHEMGHIGWYVVVDPLADPTSFCGGKFFKDSWVTPVDRPPRWRNLLTLSERNSLRHAGQWLDHHKNPPRIGIIDHPGPGDPPPNQSIHSLLAAGQPWASFFAALSDDEDFVETYKFKVLTTAAAPLTAVTITVPHAGTADIVADYLGGRKHRLETKVGCVPIRF